MAERKPAKCHPDRPSHGGGLCSSCYRRKRVADGKCDWKGRVKKPTHPPIVLPGDDLARAQTRGLRDALRGKLATPPVDPLVQAQTSRASRVEDSQAKAALRSALVRIEVLESQLDTITRPFAAPIAPLPTRSFGGGKRDATAIVLLSDVHAGANFPERNDTFGNHYNQAVCLHRLGRFFDAVHWLVRGYRELDFDIRRLVVWLGGDIVDGHLHDEQVESSQTAIATLNWFEPALVGYLAALPKLELDVDIVGSYGNHGRDTQKIRYITGAEHSHEWGMYQRLGRQLQPLGIRTLADPSPHQYVESYGRTLHFTHGDQTKFLGGVGGPSIPLNKAYSQWDKVRKADHHFCGHYHTSLVGPNRWWVMNNCMVGFGPHSMSVKADPSDPEQTFCLQDSKRGLTAVTPIWVGDKSAERDL